MDRAPRRSFSTLTKDAVPVEPGVYALYCDGKRAYVGKADLLRSRVWRSHAGKGASMTGSAMRRNVAEYLGIATSADIKARRYHTTIADAAKVSGWLGQCEIAWLLCATPLEAKELEAALKHEHMPWLTKM